MKKENTRCNIYSAHFVCSHDNFLFFKKKFEENKYCIYFTCNTDITEAFVFFFAPQNCAFGEIFFNLCNFEEALIDLDFDFKLFAMHDTKKSALHILKTAYGDIAEKLFICSDGSFFLEEYRALLEKGNGNAKEI